MTNTLGEFLDARFGWMETVYNHAYSLLLTKLRSMSWEV